MRVSRWTLVIGMVVVSVECAQATPNVVITPSNGGTWSHATTQYGESVTLTRNASVSGTVDFLLTGSGSEAFDAISVVTNNAADLTTVHIRGASANTSTGSAQSITKTGTGAVTLSELRLSGNLGLHLAGATSIGLDTVDTFIIDGTIYGNVTAVNTSFATGSAVGGSFLGNLTISTGSLTRLDVTGSFGDFFGNQPTVSINGDIITLTANFFNAFVTAGGAIDTLQVTASSTGGFFGALTAHDVSHVSGGSSGGLSLLDWQGTTLHITGNVSLPVVARHNDSSATLTIDGNVSNTIAVHSDLDADIDIGGYLASSGHINIDGGLASTGSVRIGDPGADNNSLHGQVILNAGDIGGTWDGHVYVDNAEISGPYYTVTSASLGGGAIGLAPFHVYPADADISASVIADGGYYFRPGSSTHALPNPFKIRHYGPITTSVSAKIEYRDPYGTAWADVSYMFTRMRDSSDALHRALKVQYVGSSGIPIPPGHYRVHVEAGDLICDQVDGGATSVEPYDYYFTVALDCDGSGAPGEGDFCTGSTCSGDCDLNGVNDSCDLYFDASFRDRNNNGILDSCEITTACRCDFNGDGYLNSTDFFDFINCFFGSCSGGRTADFNGDGYVNSQDFFDWLDCFFSGC